MPKAKNVTTIILKKLTKKVTTILFFILASLNGMAQQILSLSDAVNIALKNSLDIKIAENELLTSHVSNHISVAGGLPNVSGTITNNHSLNNLTQDLSNGTKTQRNNVSNNSFSAGITGSFVLYNGLRVMATKERLATLEQQSEILVNEQVQNIISAVMIKYYEIVRQQGYLKTISEALSVTLQRKRLIEIKQSVGLANNADRFQAELDSTASLQDIRSQQLILDQAKADLLNLLNLRPDSSIAINDTIIVDTFINKDSIVRKVNLHPQMLASEKQIRINELIAKETGSQRYPFVVLNGGYNLNRNQNTAGLTLLNQTIGPFVGLGLTVPIFNGGLLKRQMQVADINTKNARYIRQQTFNSLQTEVAKSFQAYQNSLAQLHTEKENAVVAAALLDLVYQRYELGVGTVLDLKAAQQSYVEAGFRLVNLSYASKIAEIQLKRLANTLAP